MDPTCFDRMAMAVGRRTTRRTVLATLGTLAATGVPVAAARPPQGDIRCGKGPDIDDRHCNERACGSSSLRKDCFCASTAAGSTACIIVGNETCPPRNECAQDGDCPGARICVKIGGCCGAKPLTKCVQSCPQGPRKSRTA